MLTQSNFSQLIRGELSDEAARELLLKMEPGDVSAEQFGEILDEMLATAEPQFQSLEQYAANSIDCCGTGGSGLPRFNTSTAVSFVLAAAGVKVAKFGNRAASSKSGSFDVLDCLGIPAQIDAPRAARMLDECNLVFLFAPSVYPALSRLSAIRKSLQKTTVFNFVGPLLNPVRPRKRLMGVSNAKMVGAVELALKTRLKTDLALIVRSQCGLDEICSGCQVDSVIVSSDNVPFQALGTSFNRGERTDERKVHSNGSQRVEPPTPQINARVMRALFDGEGQDSDAFKLVCSNAAAALLIAGRVSSVQEGEELAKDLLFSGKVRKVLDKVVASYEKR